MSLLLAKRQAQEIVREFSITQPEQIKLDKIAICKGIYSHEVEFEGADARIIINEPANNAIVTVNKAIPEHGRKRFALAHEIGHFLLHKQKNSQWGCKESDLIKYYSKSLEEPEANTFAAELLMPEDIFKQYCTGKWPSYDLLSNLADIFGTSLTSTAFRYVEIGNFPCALICSKTGSIKWYTKSNDYFHTIKPIGSKLHGFSCAGGFLQNGKIPPKNPEKVNASCWLDIDASKKDFMIFEQSVAMPAYDTVLSLIW